MIGRKNELIESTLIRSLSMEKRKKQIFTEGICMLNHMINRAGTPLRQALIHSILTIQMR
ncbi:DUF3175 domain-containing protein [Rossellomorea aquimaris]|nr:DUF3175 domain-containing protein [Rossellomorea aquimaris]